MALVECEIRVIKLQPRVKQACQLTVLHVIAVRRVGDDHATFTKGERWPYR